MKTLSDKQIIQEDQYGNRQGLFYIWDVKEFIRKILEKRIGRIDHMSEDFKIGVAHAIIEIGKEIKKEAGDKLI